MNHGCPHCGKDLATRKLSQAVIARMEIDCLYCKRRIRLNVHRAEAAIILGSFGAFALFAALAYWLPRQSLFLVAFAAAMAGAAALPLIERTWLRSWPRYVPMEAAGTRNSRDER
jgi:uncharacterized membrane protein